MTLVTLPANSSEGWHNPPMPMWFVLLRGKAVVTTYDPHDREDDKEVLSSTRENGNEGRQKVVIEMGSPNQFLIALDTLGRGHWTDYPSDEETWALQIPLAHGWQREFVAWELVNEGACV